MPWLRTIRVVCLLLVLAALAANATATVVERLSFAEIVHDASAIVVGTVTSESSRWGNAEKRWMLTDYTFQPEDVLLSDSSIRPGQPIVITFWGGTIGDETQRIADVPLPVPGGRYILFLRQGWAAGGFTPLVGMHQGMLIANADAATGVEYVGEADGTPLRVAGAGVVRSGDLMAMTGSEVRVTVSQLAAWVRANLASLKAVVPPARPAIDPRDPRLMKLLQLTPENGAVERGAPAAVSLATQDPAEPGAPLGPHPPEADRNGASRLKSTPMVLTRASAANRDLAPRYIFSGGAVLPIVVNQFPASFAPFSPEDQYQMSKWNFYGGSFQVLVTPTGTFGWANNRFDLAGWPSSAVIQAEYGRTWDPGTYGMTFTRSSGCCAILEADIALNPELSWTLDDEWVLDGSSAKAFRLTMLHELGHMWGLDHNFAFLSAMNSAPLVYRAFGLPYMDDAEAIRARYPGNALARTDLGVSLYSSGGGLLWTELTMPLNIVAGNQIFVNDYHIENVGTTTIAAPTLDWYISQTRSFGSSTHYLDTITYGSPLARGQYFATSTVGLSLNIPVEVEGGGYYLGASVLNDTSASQNSFPFSNSMAWSRFRVFVLPRLTSISVPPFAGGSTASGSVGLGSHTSGAGLNVYLTSSDPAAATVPSPIFLPAGSQSATFQITSAALTLPKQATFTADSNGVIVNTTVSILVGASAQSPNLAGSIGQKVSLKTTLRRVADNAPIAGKQVKFLLEDGDGIAVLATTNAAGVATAASVVPEGSGPGLRGYTADFDGDSTTGEAFASGTLLVTAAKTKQAPTSVAASIGALVKIKVKMTTDPGKAPVVGRTVIVGFASPTATDGAAVTDGSGLASLSLRVPTTATGALSYYARFVGDTSYKSSAGIGTLAASAAKVTLKVKKVSGLAGAQVTLEVVLTRATDKALLSGRSVTFTANGVAHTATTNASGKATTLHTIPAAAPKGNAAISVIFAADGLHLAGNGAGTLVVK